MADSGRRDNLTLLLKNLRGFTSRERQKQILERVRARTIQQVAASPSIIRKLFALLRKHSEAPRPELLGELGKRNLRRSLEDLYGELCHFGYGKVQDVHVERDFEIPYVVEVAFCRALSLEGKVAICGINHSPYMGDLLHEIEDVEWKTDRGQTREAYTFHQMLDEYDVKLDEPVALVVHIVSPNLKVTDVAKLRYDFEILKKHLAQLIYNLIKTYPKLRMPKENYSHARFLLVQELERRHQLLIEKGVIPIEEWTTQQGLFYKIRGIMGGKIGVRRKSFINAVVEECRKLGGGDLSIREKLGIRAAVRAQLFFRGTEGAVSFEEVQRLAEKGSDLLLCEKEGIAEILEPYGRSSGVAIVNSRGFATDYVRQLLAIAKTLRGNVFLLTDLDASGLLLAKKLPEFKRIGVDLEMVTFLQRKGYLKGDPEEMWEAYDTETGEAPKGHLMKLAKEEQNLVCSHRLEIDALVASVGPQHLWEAIKDRMNRVACRDLTRSMELSMMELLPDGIADALKIIRTYVGNLAQPLLQSELERYRNWRGDIPESIQNEERQVQKTVKKSLSKDDTVRRISKTLENLTQSLSG